MKTVSLNVLKISRENSILFKLFARLFFCTFLLAPALSFAQERRTLLQSQSLPDDTGKVTALNNIAYEISHSNYDSAYTISVQALQLAWELNWDEGVGRSLHFLGLFSSYKGESRKALDFYVQALDIWNELEPSAAEEDKTRIRIHKAKTLCNMGVVYMDLGDYPHALDYCFESLKISEAIGYTSGAAMCLSNIGVVYTEQGHNDKALDYYFRSLQIDKLADNQSGVATTLGNIGSVYHDQGEYEKSLEYYRQALAISEELDDRDGIAVWLGDIGMAYEHLEQTDTAFAYYFRALEIAKEDGNPITIAIQLRTIGSLYVHVGQFEKGEQFLLDALALDEESDALDFVMDDEKELSELYARMGKYDLALEHYKAYTAAKDSVYSQESAAQSVRAEMNYEFAKKQEQHEAAQQLSKTIRSFIIAIALLLILITVLLLRWRNNRKTMLLREQHSYQLLLAQEKEKQRISKELHDSIGQNMLFIKNQLIKQNDTTLLQSVSDTLEEVRNISKDLYPNQLEKYGLVAAIEALAEKVQESSSMFVSHDLSGFSSDIPQEKQINYYRIVQECVSNALKHSEATAMRITATSEKGTIELIVQDNGKGFDTQALAGKAHTSFGMLNIEERVNYLKGKFELQTSPGNGTKFTFTLPAHTS
ncbi:MAG TPA: sensor histidine kinase [Bacteroidia bacterium]|nr:sensor histidine kinase [Bacteroidia bacterium]